MSAMSLLYRHAARIAQRMHLCINIGICDNNAVNRKRRNAPNVCESYRLINVSRGMRKRIARY